VTTDAGDGRDPTDALTAAAFDALPAQVAVLDADGIILRTNRVWAEFGLDNDLQGEVDMVGEDYLAVCDASNDPAASTAAEGIRSVLAGERESFSFEYPCHSPNERRWFTMRAIRLSVDDGAHALVMHTDITERKEAELRVTAHNERLETVAGVLSHDLRNPLSVILARAEYLARDDLDPATAVDQAETIASSARRIDAIIDDALLIARETRSVDRESVDLERVATDAWSHVETGDARLVVADTGTVAADRSLLSQLLENCFRNAVEHGSTSPDSQTRRDAVEHSSTSPDSRARQDAVDHGPADVTVTVSPIEGGFAVADDGPGIPGEEREAVFEPGYTTNAAGGGTGLGLSIVRAIADAHGWDVTVTDAESGGARFEFTGVTAE